MPDSESPRATWAPDGVSNYLLIEACDALSRDNPDLQVQAVALHRMF